MDSVSESSSVSPPPEMLPPQSDSEMMVDEVDSDALDSDASESESSDAMDVDEEESDSNDGSSEGEDGWGGFDEFQDADEHLSREEMMCQLEEMIMHVEG